MKIKLEDAKAHQVRDFAIRVLGLDVKPADSLASIRAKIALVWEGDEIEVAEDGKVIADLAKGVAADEGQAKEADPDRKVTILISRTNEPGGDQPVPVAVNGRAILIPRGKPSPVAYKYVEALTNAEQAIYDPLPDGGISTEPRMVPAYPFQIIAH
jgi:hypothetical protein